MGKDASLLRPTMPSRLSSVTARRSTVEYSAEAAAESAAADAMVNKSGKLFLRGCVTNGIGLLILTGITYIQEGFAAYVGVALGLQYAVFVLHALPNGSEKYYDLSGSFTHLALVAASVLETRLRSPRQMLLTLASVVWMVRLGTFLYIRILRDGRDPRFDALKTVWLAFCGAWTLQACWVTLVQLPLLLINSRDDTVPLGPVDLLALLMWGCGFVVECVADVQKFEFRQDAANKERFITSGLWAYSRHPNYFGEILMWVATALAVSVAGLRAAEPSSLYAWLSPAFTALLLLKVSGVPMVEAAGTKKWGHDESYLHYVEHTSSVVPWFPAPVREGKTPPLL